MIDLALCKRCKILHVGRFFFQKGGGEEQKFVMFDLFPKWRSDHNKTFSELDAVVSSLSWFHHFSISSNFRGFRFRLFPRYTETLRYTFH